MSKMAGYKTIVVNALMLVAALLPNAQEFFAQQGWSTEEIAAAIVIVNLILRFVTKGPVGQRLMVLRQGGRWFTGRKVK